MINESSLQLNEHILNKGKSVLRAINHSLRQQMLLLIHEKGRIMVTDIYTSMNLEQSVASQHLAILRAAKMVNTKRQGKKVLYSVNYERIKEIHLCSERLLH